MALVNVSKMMAEYTNDFGDPAKNIPVKFTQEAIIPDGFYQDRESSTRCGTLGNLYRPRRLVATFDFGIHEYPIYDTDRLQPSILALKEEGAICIDLEGESWVNVPASLIGNPIFRTIPYPIETTDGTGVSDPNSVNGSGDKEVGDYTYTSDVEAVGDVILRYSIEKQPANLLGLIKDCLQEPQESKASFCAASSLGIRPRHFIVKAAVGTVNTMARQAKVSNAASLADCGAALGVAAYCLGYKGESIKNVGNLVTA